MSSKAKTLNLLAIDSSVEACSVALQFNNTLLERYEEKPREHTRLLLPMINSLLKEAGIGFKDLDVLACTRGPGSFTGVRIGTAVIQGLSAGLNKPVVLVSSLRALAQAAYRLNGASQVLARLEAGLQEVYWGLFTLNDQGIMEPGSEESLNNPEQIILPAGNWVSWTASPFAQDVTRIAGFEFALGHFVTSLEVQPVYLRNPSIKSAIK